MVMELMEGARNGFIVSAGVMRKRGMSKWF